MEEPEKKEELTPPAESGPPVRVELADQGDKPDPVSSVQNAELKGIADVLRYHAELLDEQRGQHERLNSFETMLKQHLADLGTSVKEWKEWIAQERSRAEEQRPPVGQPKKPFGGPGYRVCATHLDIWWHECYLT